MARSTSWFRSSSVSGFKVSTSDRESSGAITLKLGFSVVAAISVTRRFSTAGSSTSCWALLKRCTSSTNSTVGRPWASSRLAVSSWARTSLTPAVTAESSTKRRLVCLETTAAMVVLPTPGGPHRKTDIAPLPCASRRSGEPGASRCSCPTISSRFCGRIRTASGRFAWSACASEPPAGGSGSRVRLPNKSSVMLTRATDSRGPTGHRHPNRGGLARLRSRPTPGRPGRAGAP